MKKILLVLAVISLLNSCKEKNSHSHLINEELQEIYKAEIQYNLSKIVEADIICERKNRDLLNSAKEINNLFKKMTKHIDGENDNIKSDLIKISEIIPKNDALTTRLNLLLENNLKEMNKETLKTLLYELENKILNNLLYNKNRNDFTFNRLQPIVVPNKRSFKSGEILKAEIMVAAFDTMLPPLYRIEGREIETINGRGILRIQTSKSGKFKTNGSVSILKENDGTLHKYPFSFEYEVEK